MNLPSLTTVAIALLIPVLTGCGRSGQSTRFGSTVGVISWNETSPSPVGGLDHAWVVYARLGEGLRILLWTDLQNGVANWTSDSTSDSASFKGSIQSSDLKKPIDVQCQAQGANSGSLTIDGVTYDLAGGSLFLVSTKGERPVVKQLNRDTSQFKEDPESLKAFARTDPEISAIFTAREEAEPAP
jgi:hypothetical protein